MEDMKQKNNNPGLKEVGPNWPDSNEWVLIRLQQSGSFESRVSGAGKHLKHAAQGVTRAGVETHWVKVTVCNFNVLKFWVTAQKQLHSYSFVQIYWKNRDTSTLISYKLKDSLHVLQNE